MLDLNTGDKIYYLPPLSYPKKIISATIIKLYEKDNSADIGLGYNVDLGRIFKTKEECVENYIQEINNQITILQSYVNKVGELT